MRRPLLALIAVMALAVASAGFARPAIAASNAKVVIVVGATGGTTAQYISNANSAAATFSKYTSNIVKVYSPNATWANVAAAARGANILVYLGHGSGWPNPYSTRHQTGVPGDNGMGLNRSANAGNSNVYYYGEDYMAQLGLAPNSLVLLWHLCYASGNNEWGAGLPTPSVARTRVDGYASGFTRAGAAAVIAEGIGDIDPYIDMVFGQGTQTIDYVWKHAWNFHNHVSAWTSTHVDANGVNDYAGRPRTSQIDPDLDNPAGDGDYYYRSMVANTSVTGNQITGGRVADVRRWYGRNRFETAATVSRATFTNVPVPVAFVATGYNFPDALAAGPAAAKLGGPVLLVASDSLPAATAGELARIKPGKIYVLGGRSAISDEVLTSLRAYTTGGIVRLAGSSRYETAATVSLTAFAPSAPVPVAFVATGTAFPDALSAAAAGSRLGGPVLLTDSGGIPPATAEALSKLRPARIVIVGGTDDVSSGTEQALHAYTTGAVERVAGADVPTSSAAVSADTYGSGSLPVRTAFIATALNFPDALAGAAIAGRWGGPVLLIPGTSIPSSVAAELTRLKPQKIVILGGPSVISSDVQARLAAYVVAPS